MTVPGSEKGTPRGGWPLSSGLKYELDALADKDFRYLTKTPICPESSKRKTGWTSARYGASTLEAYVSDDP